MGYLISRVHTEVTRIGRVFHVQVLLYGNTWSTLNSTWDYEEAFTQANHLAGP